MRSSPCVRDTVLEPAGLRRRLIDQCKLADAQEGAMTARAIEAVQPCDLSRRWTRFVIVNNRAPRAETRCVLCCARIEQGYVRDPHTRLLYCDAQCFTEHEKM